MFSFIIMLFGHFMTAYRLLKVFRKGYTTLCEIYQTDIRPPLLKAVADPKQTWDDKLMNIMDKVFKYSPLP